MRFHYFIKWPHLMRGLAGHCASLAGSTLCPQSHVMCCGSSQVCSRYNRSAEKKLNARNFHKVSFLSNVSSASSSQKLYGDNNNNSYLIHRLAVVGQPLSLQSYFKRPYSNMSSGTRPSHPTQKQQKTPKPSFKEFNFKGKISDHDLNVKFSKIKGLLEKGKMVQIFLRTLDSGSSKPDALPVAKFQQKLIDSIGPLGKLHKDFSNKAVTRFTLTPMIKKETETSDQNKNSDDETSQN